MNHSRVKYLKLWVLTSIMMLSAQGFNLLYAQSLTQTIRGTVIDKDSKMSLPGANIVILNSDPFKGTASDADGNFRLEDIPIGRHTIKISFLGFDDVVLSNILVTSGKEVVLTIEMEESVVMGKEVVIKAGKKKGEALNEMAVVSARQFSVEETNKYAGSWGDPARMVANFAGVTGSSDQRNDIVVRGNSPIGILWRMDGVEIPNPNHFSTSGATGGGISMLNNNLLANSDFFTSAFPAEYGNAISGVFDLNMRKGNDEIREHIFQIGANGFELGSEGPIPGMGRASYLISYRYSTLGVLDKLGTLDFIGSIPEYQDLSFKLKFPHKKGYVSMFGIGGVSQIVFDAVEDSVLWDENPDDQYQEKAGSRMGVVGLNVHQFIDDKSFVRVTAATSLIQSFYTNDVLDQNYNYQPEFDTRFDEGKHILSAVYSRKFSSKNMLKAGMIWNYQYTDIMTKDYWYDDQIRKLGEYTIVDFKGNSQLLQTYAQWKHKFSPSVSMNVGAHHLYYLLNDKQSFEPRGGVKWKFSKTQSLSFGGGRHSRQLPPGVYFGEVADSSGNVTTPNKNLDFYKADHLVLGYDHSLGRNMRVKLETYYQWLFDVPVFKDAANSFSGVNMGGDFENIVSQVPLSNDGTGENYGVEVTLERFLSDGLFFLVTGSFFDSKYVGSDGVKRNTLFNGSFASNFLIGKEWTVGKKGDNILGVSATIVNIGGKRKTPIDLAASRAEHRTVRIDSLAFTEQHPNYFRSDLRISFRQNKKRFSHEIAFEAKNMFNTKNVFLEYYSTESDEIVTLYQMGLFPVAFYRIEF